MLALITLPASAFTVRQLVIAFAVTAAFTLVARWLKGVSNSGAAAGAVVSFLIYLGAGTAGFVALVTVFVVTWASTRWRYRQKQHLGIAEKRGGRRASQVLANIGIAALCALLHAFHPGQALYLLAMAAALSEAAADTVSSEIGQASSGNARLITTWKQVPAGSDGGISPVGTLAGIAAATVVSLVCAFTHLLPWTWFAISVFAAVAGMVADSVMGATLERQGFLNNDLVNFLSTCVAAATPFAFIKPL